MKIPKHLGGGKVLFILPVIALLAFGCNSAVKNDSGDNQSPSTEIQKDNNPEAENYNSPKNSTATSASGSKWTSTLQTSDNASKGKYMITVDGHKVYIHTSRDYSSLVGKEVNVSYQGTVDSFTLGDITAK